MAYRDLRDFVRKLEKEGELTRIRAEVDPVLEITEITQRVARDAARKAVPQGLKPDRREFGNIGPKGPTPSNVGGEGPTPNSVGLALLFEKPKGSKVPLLVNAFGSVRRMELAFEVGALDEVAARIRGFLEMQSPQGLFDKLKMLPKLAELGSFFPKTVKTGDCKEVVRTGEDVNLFDFPILKCWPQDGGRFITFPAGVYAQSGDGEAKRRACTGCRSTTSAPPGCTGRRRSMARSISAARGRRIPTDEFRYAVAIGADPATALAGMLPIPPDLDEMMFAGFLRREPVEMVKCETNDLEVPANAEIVLEGYVSLNEMRTEGPFGDHTGFYSLEGEFPVFHVECVTHKKDPIYLTTVVGPAAAGRLLHGVCGGAGVPAGDEDAVSGNCGCGDAGGGNLSQPDDRGDPEIVPGTRAKDHERDLVAGAGDVHEGDRGGGSRRGRARLRRGGLESAVRASIRSATCNLSFGPSDTLDHAARMQDYGSKMGIDATRKWATEGFTRPWPDEIRMDELTKARVDAIWKTLV